MFRRRLAVAVVVLMWGGLQAADAQAQARVALEPRIPARERLDLRALFAVAPGVLADDEHGIMVGPLSVEVVVAQIGPDGKLIKACVESEAAAVRFLEKPVTQNREAQEQ